mmetsp:Transcript_87235/g.241965  ORF Transcript_87235/g.241965 Transcript_87235/m.241965 type:complete len:230 (+) Transcript_87235:142-831(+)
MAKATRLVCSRFAARRNGAYSPQDSPLERAGAVGESPSAASSFLAVFGAPCHKPPTTSSTMGSGHGRMTRPSSWLGVSPPKTTTKGLEPRLDESSELATHGRNGRCGAGHRTMERQPERGCGIGGTLLTSSQAAVTPKSSSLESSLLILLLLEGPSKANNSVSVRKNSSCRPETPPVTTSRASPSACPTYGSLSRTPGRALATLRMSPMAKDVRPIRRVSLFSEKGMYA